MPDEINKIDEMVDVLRDELRSMIESAVDEGVPWDKISVMLTEVKTTADVDPPKQTDPSDRVTADQAVEMMIEQSLSLAMDKFVEALEDDKNLLVLAELILEEGHNYNLSKSARNSATVISNLRKAREAL
jgi:hypothetical protein